MIKATLNTGKVVRARTYRAILLKLMGMLDISGPRGLTAVTEDGAIIHAELYDSQDYIINPSGRVIYHS